MLVTEALSAGNLIIFIRTQDGELHSVPSDAWRQHLVDASRHHTNIRRLHRTGRSYDNPLVVDHETFAAKGIALVEKNNWAGFSKYAGRWPPYEIPINVRLLLRFCEHRQAISEGCPLRKSDAIEWFRVNWPTKLDQRWSNSDRKSKLYISKNKRDNRPDFVSEIVNAVLDGSERAGGRTSYKGDKILGGRRKRIACVTSPEIEGNSPFAEIED